MSWKALCAEHSSLKPVQLHRILTQYQLMAELGPLPIWQPSSEDEAYIYRTGRYMNGIRAGILFPETLCLLVYIVSVCLFKS